MQFKIDCVQNGLLNVSDIGIMVEFDEKQTKRNRKQSTVQDMESFNYNLKYLYKRYINYNAEYCINISSLTRNKIGLAILPYTDSITSIAKQATNLQMHTKQHNVKLDVDMIKQFIELIDYAIEEIMKLLTHDSYSRFIRTDDFKHIAMETPSTKT